MIAQQTNSVVVNNPPSISSGALPPLYVGQAFTHQFTVTGGQSPYGSWSLASGAFPPGLTLNATTGVLSGSPTTAGPFEFTVAIPDANG